MKTPVLRYAALFVIMGCIQSVCPLFHPEAESALKAGAVQENDDSNLKADQTPAEPVWPYGRREIANALEILLDDWNESMFAVDDSLIRHVCYFYKYYAMIDSRGSNEVIRRGREYLPYIKTVFREYRLPEELSFAVPFVESAFKNEARSNKKAVGLFQFLETTAKAYGLTVNADTDERMDYRKSAEACVKYLSENRNVFGSTVLSLGSFHHGTSKLIYVLRHLPMKENRRSFVSIFNNRELGKYSKEYIPKCLAASLIYRFMNNRGLSEIPEMEIGNKKLERFAYVSDLKKDIPEIHLLNPDLENALTTYIYATTRGYLLIDNAEAETLSYLRKMTPSEPGEPVSQKNRDSTFGTDEIQAKTHRKKEPVPIVSGETPNTIADAEKSEAKPLDTETPEQKSDQQPEIIISSEQAKPSMEVETVKNTDGKDEAPAVGEGGKSSEPEDMLAKAPPFKPDGSEENHSAAREFTKIPRLTGEKWKNNIRKRYPAREIVMNESYTGNVEDIGVIIDQNLKPGEIWKDGHVLIIEVGRPPIPEDNLSEEEYSKFTQEYMMKLRNGELF